MCELSSAPGVYTLWEKGGCGLLLFFLSWTGFLFFFFFYFFRCYFFWFFPSTKTETLSYVCRKERKVSMSGITSPHQHQIGSISVLPTVVKGCDSRSLSLRSRCCRAPSLPNATCFVFLLGLSCNWSFSQEVSRCVCCFVCVCVRACEWVSACEMKGEFVVVVWVDWRNQQNVKLKQEIVEVE